MTGPATPHEGIELDAIDLSKMTNHSTVQLPKKQNTDKERHKKLLTGIFNKILDNKSFFSSSVQIKDINEILQMKYSSASDIADVILKDVALTTKLLRLVNSSFYGQFSNNGISTVSEAMIILGTEEIKLAAASLKIYEFMHDITNIKILKEKGLKALQRSIIARQIAIDEGLKDSESIQISAMLYDFGEYMVALFSPQVFINIEICIDEENLSREQASKSIMGISYSELGRFVASKWNLPSSIINAMIPVTTYSKKKNQLSIDDLQRYICAFSNDLCNTGFSMEENAISKNILLISRNYSHSLEISTSDSIKLFKSSWEKITKHAAILEIDTKNQKI
ncbi:MAG: HDOD domain-containing protein [Desulfobacteraceae bacterium]|nr:HDOD domain-containing protein [Desulfobacteraceae bacterium]